MLHDQLELLRKIIPPGRPVVYLDYAVYSNVGDLLIHKASDYFFAINGNRVIDAYNLQNYTQALEKEFPADAIIVFQGGGNLGDLYPRHDRLRLDVLSAFPKHRAVVLPQTAYYEQTGSAEKITRDYGQFDRLTICLRDRRSFDLFEAAHTSSIELVPDMAHLLGESAFVAQAIEPKRNTSDEALYFMRQPWRIEEIDWAKTPFDATDITVWNWPEYLNAHEQRRIKFARKLHRWDGKRVHSRVPWWAWQRSRDAILNRALRFFAGQKYVHTNRLHGGLFGLLCGCEIVFYDTGYGKLTGYYETWLNDEPKASFAGAVARTRNSSGL